MEIYHWCIRTNQHLMMISLTRCRPALQQYRMLLLWNINQQSVKSSHQEYQLSNQNLLKRRRKLLHLSKVRYEKIRDQSIVSTDFVQIIIVEKNNTHMKACWFSVPTCFSSCLKFFPLGFPFFSISCRNGFLSISLSYLICATKIID